MTTADLTTLIEQAQYLAGGNCAANIHDWRTDGGRACPVYDYVECSQPVFRCGCGAWDFGDRGGPGRAWCNENCEHGARGRL